MPSPVLQIRMPETEMGILKDRAASRGVTPSELGREFICAGLLAPSIYPGSSPGVVSDATDLAGKPGTGLASQSPSPQGPVEINTADEPENRQLLNAAGRKLARQRERGVTQAGPATTEDDRFKYERFES